MNVGVSNTEEDQESIEENGEEGNSNGIIEIWKGVSSMRGTVANKAKETIGDALGLLGMKRDGIVKAIKWMLKDLKKVHKGGEGDEDISLPFISGDLDIKTKTFNWNKPFSNLFFSAHILNSPLPILALITTVMECTLSCWKTGVFIKKDFRDAYYKPKCASRLTYDAESSGEGSKVDNENEGRDVPEYSDDGEGDGGNGRQEGKIDVDYDALEVSAV
ncbi:hypothetical protein BDR05DRAFT_947351 [Suillus weaverae]|nr:hypothetical protein BDR05DRAFT_947351 [Suillus weaverae]